jgi:pyruvate formate lyase activating enzyme
MQVGICGVRQNIDSDLKLLVYGKAISANVDPIEKKPLFHFLPGTEIFSFGTIGCNFGCEFCQNWDISQASKGLQSSKGAQSLENSKGMLTKIGRMGSDLSPKQIIETTISQKLPSIAYTYNEPGIFFEYAYDTAKLAHENGIKNVFVSNGYSSKESIDKMTPYLDAINIDLKSFNEDFYMSVCKASRSKVLEGIEYYYSKKVWMELTTLLIPGKNDSTKEMKQIAKYIAGIDKDIPWHVSAFTPKYRMKNVKETSDEKLLEAYNIGKEAGLNFVYVGNTFNKELQSTYCPKCKALLIERDWGYVEVKACKKGVCNNCNYKIPGVWE